MIVPMINMLFAESPMMEVTKSEVRQLGRFVFVNMTTDDKWPTTDDKWPITDDKWPTNDNK